MAQSNLRAAAQVGGLLKSTLGPSAMRKMLLDPMGGIAITNDGHAILREIDVMHPAARQMIENSRAQDEEVGDGTTSVIVIASSLCQLVANKLQDGTTMTDEGRDHPIRLTQALATALADCVQYTQDAAFSFDANDGGVYAKVVNSCLGTKSLGAIESLLSDLAVEAVRTVSTKSEVSGRTVVDVKRYARIEKIPGGRLEDSRIVRGVLLNKDVVHAKMRRSIDSPRIVLLDCPLEYKKGENPIEFALNDPNDFAKLIDLEEKYVRMQVEDIGKLKPDLVVTEKGLSDLASHYLKKNNISAIRRIRKTDNNRLARACGATIAHRTDELQESDVGTNCGVMKITKIGDEYFTFLEECKGTKACSILLRGPSRDILNEIERNLHDAMAVASNLERDPRYVAGGGSVDMLVSCRLRSKAQTLEGTERWGYEVLAEAIESIPQSLIANCGGQPLRTVTELRATHAKHLADGAEGVCTTGVDGLTGELVDVEAAGVIDPVAVKVQQIKTAVESVISLVRVDEILQAKGEA